MTKIKIKIIRKVNNNRNKKMTMTIKTKMMIMRKMRNKIKRNNRKIK